MQSQLPVTRFLTRKNALNQSGTDSTSIALPLRSGEVVLKIDRVAVTTNNITYAAFGDAMQYWNFFPTQDVEWGHMPVWGFADVVISTVEGVDVGQRFYGYFPIASHIKMQAARVTDRGFYDVSEHRLSLTSAYNHYVRTAADPAYVKELENFQMIVRPLFITSFMCADFLQGNDFFGAKQVVISSASSKTAYGTAFCLKDKYDVKLIGLTSQKNRDFVVGLGCYDEVVTYENLDVMARDVPTTYVDFSGDVKLRSSIHHYFAGALKYDCYAGSAQNTEFLQETELPGPKPTFYFAPVQIRKRNSDWGYEVVNQRFNEAQNAFIQRIGDAEKPWMELVEHRGFASAESLIEDMHSGRINPQIGHVLVLGD